MSEISKKINFISGLPRSGSTLLANILAQNPRFHTTATSGIADIIFGVRNQWDKLVEFQAHPDEAAKRRVLRGILYSYYENIDKPVIFDKSRSWVSLIEMANSVLDHKPKILVPVREIRDILASFEKIWRRVSSSNQLAQEHENYLKFQFVEGRCEVWMGGNQPLGLAYGRVRDAIIRGHSSQMFFVEFEALTHSPEKTMKEIYSFLDEKYYDHNFDCVEQVTWENDRVHGVEGLHDIRKKVVPMEPQWPNILGHAADPYKGLEFWRHLNKQT